MNKSFKHTPLSVNGDTFSKVMELSFDSIAELLSYIHNEPYNSKLIVYKRDSAIQSAARTRFSGTKSFDEALDLLSHGWEDGAKLIEKGLKESIKNSTSTSYRQRSVYDVIGGNASVPRYLQGIPNNMIRQVKNPVKQPIANVYVDMAFSCSVDKETIINDCIKALQKVVNLENAGTRVNLYGYRTCHKDSLIMVQKVCLKHSSERLNISKLAFSAAHPSMLRRILLAVDEHTEELSGSWFTGYGYPLKGEDMLEKVENALK